MVDIYYKDIDIKIKKGVFSYGRRQVYNRHNRKDVCNT